MQEERCPGKGLCHGCLKWCEWCGDVDQDCECRGKCEQHMPCEYPGCARVGYEGLCDRHLDYDPEGAVRAVLES